MFKTNAFDYINVLGKAADGAWLRNEAIANNLANATTPNYKREDVDFESQLKEALGPSKYESMDFKVSRLNKHLRSLNPTTYTDSSNYSYRLDGNNVDVDTENVELAANQIKYNGLMASIENEFSNLKAVLK
ncbi:MAG: flagellar basal body rod protein FlgB [Lachnospiraceae bacterium]|nr:flagellar basal body rod protein FlgB [Lachnospiraceae bacterium]